VLARFDRYVCYKSCYIVRIDRFDTSIEYIRLFDAARSRVFGLPASLLTPHAPRMHFVRVPNGGCLDSRFPVALAGFGRLARGHPFSSWGPVLWVEGDAG
jgi:hypothetical protein